MTCHCHTCNEKETATPVGGSGTLRVTLISSRKQVIQIDFRALSQDDFSGPTVRPEQLAAELLSTPPSRSITVFGVSRSRLEGKAAFLGGTRAV